MWEIFGPEVPEVLRRTVEIAEMCDLNLPTGINHLPNYPIPAAHGAMAVEEYFEKVVREGYQTRKAQVWEQELASGLLAQPLDQYEQRLIHEMNVIRRMGCVTPKNTESQSGRGAGPPPVRW
jgi:DNA polymerase-3 subunit alpha